MIESIWIIFLSYLILINTYTDIFKVPLTESFYWAYFLKLLLSAYYFPTQKHLNDSVVQRKKFYLPTVGIQGLPVENYPSKNIYH